MLRRNKRHEWWLKFGVHAHADADVVVVVVVDAFVRSSRVLSLFELTTCTALSPLGVFSDFALARTRSGTGGM